MNISDIRARIDLANRTGRTQFAIPWITKQGCLVKTVKSLAPDGEVLVEHVTLYCE